MGRETGHDGTQPAGQTCSVANGTGTVGAADVTDINITCG